MAASFTRAYRFVWPAIVAKHLWCEQPVKEIQASATSKSVFILVLTAISYGESIVDRPRSPTPPVPIAISSSESPLLSFTPVRWMNTANFINIKVRVCYSFSKHNIFSTKAIESFIIVWYRRRDPVSKTGNAFLRLDFQKLSHFCFEHKDNANGAGGSSRSLVLLLFTRFSRDCTEIFLFGSSEVYRSQPDVLGRSARGPARTFSDVAPGKGLNYRQHTQTREKVAPHFSCWYVSKSYSLRVSMMSCTHIPVAWLMAAHTTWLPYRAHHFTHTTRLPHRAHHFTHTTLLPYRAHHFTHTTHLPYRAHHFTHTTHLPYRAHHFTHTTHLPYTTHHFTHTTHLPYRAHHFTHTTRLPYTAHHFTHTYHTGLIISHTPHTAHHFTHTTHHSSFHTHHTPTIQGSSLHTHQTATIQGLSFHTHQTATIQGSSLHTQHTLWDKYNFWQTTEQFSLPCLG